MHNVGVERRFVGQRGEQPAQRPGQIGEQTAFDCLRQLDQRAFVDDLLHPCRRCRLHVVPHTDASTMATEYSGSHRDSHVSRKVP